MFPYFHRYFASLFIRFISMAWSFRRRVKIFAVATTIFVDYKAMQKFDKWTAESNKADFWEKGHERNAKRVLNMIIELEGLWVKLGQFLSTRADVLPHTYISHLKKLQDSLPPRPLQEVCQTIEKELRKPMDDLFSDFDKTPLATASIAQVHRATLIDGRQVVVKVQHEGIKTSILEDLKNAKLIADWIAWAEPQYDFNPVIDEWSKEVPKELDFDNEAENTRTVANNLGCRNKNEDRKLVNQVDVLIPEVIQSSEKVLILEYVDGIRLNDLKSLEAYGVDKKKVVEEITKAYAHQIYVDGFFNGDPHPGNFLVSKDDQHRPVLLDFGLTKKVSSSVKQALAKMFIASVEGDQVALLSAFTEMGLKLRLDIPDHAMEVVNVFFSATIPANESFENAKSLAEQRSRGMKLIQEKMKLSPKEAKRFNPVDAFPGDVVIFSRVLSLLRGLSSLMNVRIIYEEIMRPFAEFALQGNVINKGVSGNPQWIHNTPVHSNVETKLRQLLIELGNEDKISGIQVCAYKDGNVIIDTAAGVLGRYDPRPVQPDTLFPIFTATKGITTGLLHWLVDNGKLKLDDNVATIWPQFGINGKDHIKVCHVLNHTSGLHNALSDLRGENSPLLADWDACLNRICLSVPETEPGKEQLYHFLSFGWLCGGIVEQASGKKFQEILEEAIIRPLKIEGELYIGIPPGVESRLATLTVDMMDLRNPVEMTSPHPDLPYPFQPSNVAQILTTVPAIFNKLNVRRTIIPAANGHCSARALARYYAALADGGIIPPPHSSFTKPILGTHTHIPKFSSEKISKKQRGKSKEKATSSKNRSSESDDIRNPHEDVKDGDNTRLDTDRLPITVKIFNKDRIHEAFMGVGEFENMVIPNGNFGLGFRRNSSNDGSLTGFGHSGIGGSTGFCHVESKFAIAVTVNELSFGFVTRKIIHLVCSELNVPVPEEFVQC